MNRSIAQIVLGSLALCVAVQAQQEAVPVRLVGEIVFMLRDPGDAGDLLQRADEVAAQLREVVAQHQDAGAPPVEVAAVDGTPALVVGDLVVVRVLPGDLDTPDDDPEHMARAWQVELEAALLKAIPEVMDLGAPLAADDPIEPEPTLPEAQDSGEPRPIQLGETVIARVRHSGASPTISGRAAEVNARLAQVLEARALGYAPQVTVEQVDETLAIYVGSFMIIRVFEEDAAVNDSTPSVLAAEWQANLTAALDQLPLPEPPPTPPANAADPEATDGQVIHVMVSSAIVARIRARGEAPSVRERGALIDARITDIISWENCAKPEVRIVEEDGVPAIYVGSRLLMHVYEADAAPNGNTPLQQAGAWRKNLVEWLPRAPSMAARPGRGPRPGTAHCTDPLVGDAGRVDLPPGAYTGLIIDATGMRTMRSIYPRIFGPRGGEVWGTVGCSAAWAIGRGTAAWAHGLQSARASERAGANPLVIRAQRVFGAARCNFEIAAQDTRRVRAANRIGQFLDNCNVVIAQ